MKHHCSLYTKEPQQVTSVKYQLKNLMKIYSHVKDLQERPTIIWININLMFQQNTSLIMIENTVRQNLILLIVYFPTRNYLIEIDLFA
jgi:hypothetical protein